MTRSLACSRFGFAGLFRGIGAAGAVAAACAVLLAPSNALACGGDGDVVVRPVISFPNQSAQALLTAAADLEGRASSMDVQAVNLAQRASEANVDARAIRVQAASSESTAERTQLFTLANQLSTQASLETQTAQSLRRQSTALREEARLDRVRAAQLTGGGGGWRGRPVSMSQARI
ncbi:MAG: hypothetical protein ABI461_18010 [Polyangiaceae bacterium]